MICDCGSAMIYDGERWECLECGRTIIDEEYEEGDLDEEL